MVYGINEQSAIDPVTNVSYQAETDRYGSVQAAQEAYRQYWSQHAAGDSPPMLPPQGPPQRPATGKQWYQRKAVWIVGGSAGLLTAIIVAGALAPANHDAARPAAPPTATTAPATTAPATTAPPSASQQVLNWYNNQGGKTQVAAVSADLTTVGNDTTAYANGGLDSADGTTLQTDDATFQSDILTLQSNLPPNVIPGMRADVSSALTYYSTASTDINNMVVSANAGDYTDATTDATAANTAITNGNTQLSAATAAINSSTSN